MSAAAANSALLRCAGWFRFEQDGVEIWKIVEFEPRNLSPNEMFNRLQGLNFLAVHQSEGVPDILRAAGAANAMDVIFRMFGHIVIDDVTDAGDIETARGDIGRDHDLVFAGLETIESFDAFALRAIGMQDRDGMIPRF